MRKTQSNQDPRGGGKQRIMTAAEAVFAERGYAAASVSQIARAAQANRALLYYYFRNKRDLYRAIIERGLQEIAEVLVRVSEEDCDPWARLEKFVRAYYELLLGRPNMGRVVLRELAVGSEKLGPNVQKYVNQSLGAVRRMLEEGIRGGAVEALDPELTAFSLLGMIHVFFMQRLATGHSFPAEVVAAHTLALLRFGAQRAAAPEARAASSRKGSP